MSQKIYTKKGDTGHTLLIGGTKVSKANIRIEAYGMIDELNSWIGLVNDKMGNTGSHHILRKIQDRLFTIGAILACDPHKQTKLSIPNLHEADIIILEKEIDNMNKTLPDMEHFILPGGHVSSSVAHIARCVCRRAERCCVRLIMEDGQVDTKIIKYLNRLGDYLFVLARYFGKLYNVEEVIWKSGGYNH